MAAEPRWGFPRSMRLRHLPTISLVFAKGKSVAVPPVKLLYIRYQSHETPAPFPQVLVVVPKKLHKKAVVRNRIKRQLREIYRLHRTDYDLRAFKAIAIVYTQKKLTDYQTLCEAVCSALARIAAQPAANSASEASTSN